MEPYVLIVLILICVVALCVLAGKRNKLDEKKSPGATGFTSTVPSPPKVEAKPTSAPKVNPPAPPSSVVTLFEDTMYNGRVRCRDCDGENPRSARVCEICGKEL